MSLHLNAIIWPTVFAFPFKYPIGKSASILRNHAKRGITKHRIRRMITIIISFFLQSFFNIIQKSFPIVNKTRELYSCFDVPTAHG